MSSDPKIELMDVDDVEEKVDENDGKEMIVFEQKERVTTRYI